MQKLYSFQQIKEALINLASNDCLPQELQLLTEEVLFPQEVIFQLKDRFNREIGLVKTDADKNIVEEYWEDFSKRNSPVNPDTSADEFIECLREVGYNAERSYYNTIQEPD